eukprot:9473877-Pyramimonas_sp.AAC.1
MPASDSVLSPTLFQPAFHLACGDVLTSQSSFGVAFQTLHVTFWIFPSSTLAITRRVSPQTPPPWGGMRSSRLPWRAPCGSRIRRTRTLNTTRTSTARAGSHTIW